MGSAGTFCQRSPAAITGNSKQPGFKRALLIPLVQVVQDTQERFLCCVFSILAMTEHAEAKPKYLGAIMLDQFCDRSLVASETGGD